MSEDWSAESPGIALPMDPGNASHYFAGLPRDSRRGSRDVRTPGTANEISLLNISDIAASSKRQERTSASYPQIVKGGSLLLSFRPLGRTVLIIGAGRLAASRAVVCLEAGANVQIATLYRDEGAEDKRVDNELQWRAGQGEIELLEHFKTPLGETSELSRIGFDELWLDHPELCLVIFAQAPQTLELQKAVVALSKACRSRRVPLTVHDTPDACDFAFLSSHKDGYLQIGVTTNGMGCRLAGRIRRELVGRLPKGSAQAVEKLGLLRMSMKSSAKEGLEGESDHVQLPALPIGSDMPDEKSEAKRRMEWLAQISEYWPIDYLAKMNRTEMIDLMQGYMKQRAHTDKAISSIDVKQESAKDPSIQITPTETMPTPQAVKPHVDGAAEAAAQALPVPSRIKAASKARSPDRSRPRRARSISARRPIGPSPSPHRLITPNLPGSTSQKGRIILAGSGPGSPALLTLAAYNAIVSPTTTLILSDKLVPSPVIDLIPASTPLVVARKFPGVADDAQDELQKRALEHAQSGGTVLRLKQGDPFVFGRGGEEVIFFRANGFEPIVIPGISSALAGPTLAGIPVTHRGVADQMLVTTGVGRKGKAVILPGYNASRTLVILMALARLESVVHALTTTDEKEAMAEDNASQRHGAPYPRNTPVAIVERASCLDQRVIVSTLSKIQDVVEVIIKGGARPPGLLVIGWSTVSLLGAKDDVIFSKQERNGSGKSHESEMSHTAKDFLGAEGYQVIDGLPEDWIDFETQVLDEQAGVVSTIKEEEELPIPQATIVQRSANDAMFLYGSSIPIFTTVLSFRAWHKGFATHETLGYVPTMGALHQGHVDLIKQSLKECSKTVVSIFVNPAQFAPSEDFAKYPRTIESDLALLARLAETEGRSVDAIFLPQVPEMYPSGITQEVKDQVGTFVEVKGKSHQMEGASRPTFFRGVATIVTKLLNVVQAEHAYFGQKDIQQCIVLSSLIRDLLIPTQIHVVETARDPNTGLALSSRNAYLLPEEAQFAPSLYKALTASLEAYQKLGCRLRLEILAPAQHILQQSQQSAQRIGVHFEVLYISLVSPQTLEELISVDPNCGGILSMAVVVGKTRLIDNVLFDFWP